MAGLVLPKRRITLPAKPQEGASVNWSNPLARDLVFVAIPGAANRTDVVSGKLGSLLTSGSWNGNTRHGSALASSSITDGGASWPFPPAVARITDKLTVVVIARVDTTTDGSCLLTIPYANGTFVSPFESLMFSKNDVLAQGLFFYAQNASTSTSVGSGSGFIQAGDPLTVYGVTRNGTAIKFYRDGVLFTSTTIAAGSHDWGGQQPITLMNRSSSSVGRSFVGATSFAAMWGRELSETEMRSVALDPYAMLGTPPRLWVGFSAPTTTQIVRIRRQITAPAKPQAGTVLNWSHPLARGLVRAWEMSGPLPIGQRELVKAQDNLVLGGGATQTWKPAASATSRYGTLSGIDIPSGNPLTMSAALPSGHSIEVVLTFRTLRTGGLDYSAIVDAGTFGLQTKGNGSIANLNYSTGPDHLGSTVLQNDRTYHLFVIDDGAAAKIYLDGKLEISGAFTVGARTFVRLGASSGAGADPFIGVYHTVRMWDRIVTPGEAYEQFINPYALVQPIPPCLWVIDGPSVSVQLLRPASDVSDGTWTDQAGGTSLFAAIDETPFDDADYIRSSLTGTTDTEAKVRVAVGVDPASSTGHIVRYRYKKDVASGDNVDLRIRLYDSDGTTVIASQTHTNISDTWTAGTFTLSGGEADAVTGYTSGLVLGFLRV